MSQVLKNALNLKNLIYLPKQRAPLIFKYTMKRQYMNVYRQRHIRLPQQILTQQYRFFSLRQAISPQTQLESQFFNSQSFRELFKLAVENKDKNEMRWKHAYFFFRCLRHLQQKQNSIQFQDRTENLSKDKELRKLEQEALEAITYTIKRETIIKGHHMVKIIELAVLCDFKYQGFWDLLNEILALTVVYESLSDILDMCGVIIDCEHFNQAFWQKMIEKIASMNNLWTTKDMIAILRLFQSVDKNIDTNKFLEQHTKVFIAQEIEQLNVQDVVNVIELYKDDFQFRKFLAINLKEKLLKGPSVQVKTLMTIITETLDIEEVRKDIIRYALKTENFYAFPLSYYITIINKIQQVGRRDDLNDFLKTIQINLSIKETEINDWTLRKLIVQHQILPILSVPFLQMIGRGNMRMLDSEIFKPGEYSLYSLNISQISLPSVDDPELIETYEAAMSYELSQENFGIYQLIYFLQKYPSFTRYGFYKGFSNIIISTFLSDEKAGSESWIVSIIHRLVTLGITDPEFNSSIDKLLIDNFERFANLSLLKLTIVYFLRGLKNPQRNDQLLKRLRGVNPEHIAELKQHVQLIQALQYIDNKDIMKKWISHIQNRIDEMTLEDATLLMRVLNQVQDSDQLYQDAKEKLIKHISMQKKTTIDKNKDVSQ